MAEKKYDKQDIIETMIATFAFTGFFMLIFTISNPCWNCPQEEWEEWTEGWACVEWANQNLGYWEDILEEQKKQGLYVYSVGIDNNEVCWCNNINECICYPCTKKIKAMVREAI